MIKKSDKNLIHTNKGFTLLEIIIVIAIIAVLTGIAALGIDAYIENSERIYREDTAKSLYYGLQDKLTSLQRTGSYREDFVDQMAGKEVKTFTLDEMKAIMTANGCDQAYIDDYVTKHTSDGTDSTYDRICAYIYDGANPDEFIYNTIFDITGDEKSLEHTFLLEINMDTGVVQSVFYSEDVDLFEVYSAYDTNSTESKGNVIIRDLDALRAKKQGYFGVYITSFEEMEEVYTPTIEETDIKLVNGDRIYVKFIDKAANNNGNGNGNGNKKDVTYKLIINAYGENNAIETVATIPIEITNIAQLSEMGMLDSVDYSTNTELSDLSIKKQVELETGKVKAYENYILLDCLHRDYIRQNYEDKITSITGKPLEQSSISVSVIRVTPRGNSGKDREEDLGTSNIINPVFEGYNQTGDTYTYYIANTRQLVNMQDVSRFDGKSYKYNEYNFALTDNIYMDLFECEGLSNDEKTNTSYDASKGESHAYKYSSDDFAFGGSFNGNNHTIRGLYIDKNSSNQGLFCTVGFDDKAAVVINTAFEDAYIRAGESVGVVAGKLTNGQITHVSVDGASVEGRFCVGGIVGTTGNTSDSKLENCSYTGRVTATGTASENVNINYCEITDTGVVDRKLALANTASFAGGIVGLSYVPIVDCKFYGQGASPNVSGFGDFVGGIAGYSSVGLSDCDLGKLSVSGSKYVGGIAGACNDTITNCHVRATEESTSVVKGTGNAGHVAGIAAYAKGIKDSSNNAVIMGNGVGIAGIVAVLADADDNKLSELNVEACENGKYGSVMVGGVSNYVGGVVGRARENVKITNTKSNGDILASNFVLDNAGGLLGYVDSNLAIVGTTASASVICNGKLEDDTVTVDVKKHVNISGFVANAKGNVDIEKSGTIAKDNDNKPEVTINNCDLYNVGGIVSNIDNTKSLRLVDVQNTANIKTNGNAYYVGGVAPSLRYDSDKLTLVKLSNNGDITVGDISDATQIDNPENAEGKKKAAYIGGIVGMLSYPENSKRAYTIAFDGLNGNTLTNKGNIAVTGYTRFTGGLIGYTDLYPRLIDVNNEGNITTKDYGDWIGGLVGIISPVEGDTSVDSSEKYALINQSTNRGDISIAGIASCVGGFVGRVDISLYVNAGPGKTSGHNSNLGDISIGMTKTGTKELPVADELTARTDLGLDDLLKPGAFDKNIKNIKTGLRESDSMGGIGGFIGYISYDSSYIGCVNEGDIKTTYAVEARDNHNTKKNSINIGGIVGHARKANHIEDCIQKGDITTSSFATFNTGGICGLGMENADIVECTNQGAINIGFYGDNIGGILGRCDKGIGGVRYCSTTSTFKININKSAYCNGNIGGILGHIEADGSDTNYLLGNVAYGEINVLETDLNNATAKKGLCQAGGIAGNIEGTTNAVIEDNSNHININVHGQAESIGGIIGHSESYNSVYNCKNYGNITIDGDGTKRYIAGLIGYFGKSAGGAYEILFDSCENEGNITLTGTSNNVGGIVGYGLVSINEYKFVECKNSGDIKATGNLTAAGGIAGYLKILTSLDKCENTGNIECVGVAKQLGGLLGYEDNIANISESTVSDTNISSTANMTYVGGLVGNVKNDAIINNSKAQIKIVNGGNGNDLRLAGIIGYAGRSAEISDCKVLDGSYVKVMNNPESFVNTTANYIGGLVARAGSGTLTLGRNEVCMDFEFHENASNIGGIIGYIDQGTIGDLGNNSYTGSMLCLSGGNANPDNLLTMPGNLSNAGGVVGFAKKDLSISNIDNTILIKNIYADGKIENVGGILGKQDAGSLKLSDIEIKGSNISAKGSMSSVGGVLGYTKAPTEIYNIEQSATIKCEGTVNGIGGIVGKADTTSVGSTMSNANSNCLIEADNQTSDINIGGIIGNNQGFSRIDTAKSRGSIVVKNMLSNERVSIGGIVAYNNVVTEITGCTSQCSIDTYGRAANIGGILGNVSANYVPSIKGCINSGNITSHNYVDASGNPLPGHIVRAGGIVGNAQNTIVFDTYNNIKCKNEGNITASGNLSNSGGIIGQISKDLIIENADDVVDIENVVIHSAGCASNVGGFIGYAKCNLNLQAITVGGSITAGDYINGAGGIVGWAQGNIELTDSTYDGQITSGSYMQNAGGILGWTKLNLWVSGVKYAGQIKSNGYMQYVGGIVGKCESTLDTQLVIEDNISNASIEALGYVKYAGGIVGGAKGNTKVARSNYEGQISAESYMQNIGGIMGGRENMDNSNTVIENCISNSQMKASTNGSTTAVQCIGGILGYNKGKAEISNNTVTYLLVDVDNESAYTQKIGGVVGAVESNQDGLIANNTSSSEIMVVGKLSTTGGFVGYTDRPLSIDGGVSTTNISSTGSMENVGGLVGQLYNQGDFTIKNITTNSQIVGASTSDSETKVTIKNVGGVVGYTGKNVNIDNVINSFIVSAGDYINTGGLVGIVNNSGTLEVINATQSETLANASELAIANKVKKDAGSAKFVNISGDSSVTIIVPAGLMDGADLLMTMENEEELLEDVLADDSEQPEGDKEEALEEETVVDEDATEVDKDTNEPLDSVETGEEVEEKAQGDLAEKDLEQEDSEDEEKDASPEDNSTPEQEDGIVEDREDAILPEDITEPDSNAGEAEIE